jgi:hypothetical protein
MGRAVKYIIATKKEASPEKENRDPALFFLNFTRITQLIKDYRKKYDGINPVLENNPGILDTFHEDLKDFGSTNGRESKFSSEQILRFAVVSSGTL